MKPRVTKPPPSRNRIDDAEEPEITQEDSVPSDGKDRVGEKMMEQLGRERRGEQAKEGKEGKEGKKSKEA